MKHCPALDGIRGLAIIVVLLFHFNVPGHLESGVLKGGYLGVDIFFVLSGFLITSILLEEYDKSGKISLPKFYFRRVLRLFPALALVLIASFFYAHFIEEQSLESKKIIRGIFSTLFYYSNWINAYESAPLGFLTHTWSLAVEEQFYILWPCLIIIIFRFTSLRAHFTKIVLALIFTSLAIKCYFAYHSQFLRAYAGTDSRADALLIGCLFAYWSREHKINLQILTNPLPLLISCIFVTLLLVFSFHNDPLMYYCGYATFAFLSGVVIVALVREKNRFVTLLFCLPPLRFMGKISYGTYLWHLPIHAFYAHILGNDLLILRNCLAVCTTILVAQLSFKYVELPFLEIKKKYNVLVY